MVAKGEKITLRTLKLEHIPKCWEWINDKTVTKHLGIPIPKSYRAELKWFRDTQKNKNEHQFAIIDNETGLHIGNTGVHQIDKQNEQAFVGILIGERSFWGKGYCSDVMSTLVEICFNRLKLNKVSLVVFPENIPAQKCYKKVGFKKVALLKDNVKIKGKFRDSLLMETFAKDFDKKKS